MTTELMKVIAQENLGSHIEKELEKEALKSLIDPLQVWITRWDSQTPRFTRLPFYIAKGGWCEINFIMEEYLNVKFEICMYIYIYIRISMHIPVYMYPPIEPCMNFRSYIDLICVYMCMHIYTCILNLKATC